MPYTFDATFERSNPIPALESSDPAFAAIRAAGKRLIDDDYKSDWFFALRELLKFRRNDPDPLRREHCIDNYDVQGALWIVDEDGSVTDAMAEFNEYFKQVIKNDDEDFQTEDQSPLTDKLIHASMEGRLYIRPLGERTFRQVQTAVKDPKAEELEFNLSVSTPVSKVLRPEIKAREITAEEMEASPIEPMPKPQKPNILKRIFAIFFRAELAQYERDMAVWQEHQTLEQLREETLAYFRAAAEADAEERYAAEQQRVREAQENQDEIYSAIDEAFVVDLTDEELQAEVDAFDKAHEGKGLTVEELKVVRAEEERIKQEQANAAKQAEIDRLNTQYPGMLQMQQDAGQKYEELTHYMLKRQQDTVLRAAYALLPELQALSDLKVPEYWKALQEDAAGSLPMGATELARKSDFNAKLAAAALKKNVELAQQYPVGSKEFRIIANASKVLCEDFMDTQLMSVGLSREELDVTAGIIEMQKLYMNNLLAEQKLSSYILEGKDWRTDKYDAEKIAKALGNMVAYRFVDGMMKLNQDAGPEVQRYLYAGLGNVNADDFSKYFPAIEPCKKLLEKGPEQMLKLLNNPDLMQKFAVDAMQKLNEHYECRNIVYKMNMMEFTGPLPVSPDGVVSELPAPAVTVKMMG